jgi:hypothetical protein
MVPHPRHTTPAFEAPRNLLLRMMDTLAEEHMRHTESVINRGQRLGRRMTSVTQPSSASERSSTSPCDR